MKHHCGLFAVAGHLDAARLTYLGLHAQQHRGEESAGICYSNSHALVLNGGMGLVQEAVDRSKIVPVNAAIGHVRYSTTGSSCLKNIQPMIDSTGSMAVAHNGNLTNAEQLRKEIGGTFRTSTDTEVVLRLFEDRTQTRESLMRLEGAFCLLIMTQDRIIAIRDPLGFRPMCLGEVSDEDGCGYVIASETVALDAVGARYLRDIEPGEVFSVKHDGTSPQIIHFGDSSHPAQCIFEHVYFANPASNVFGQNVHLSRRRMGNRLVEEQPVEADIVVPVPHSGIDAALGFSEGSGITYSRAFTTNNYCGRSFIMPDQSRREEKVHAKLHVIREAVAGMRICVVEDSVVRGTTTRLKMNVLREAGAKEVHLRVASPPIRHGCYFGIDFPDASKLIATGRTVEEIGKELGVDSMGYLSVEGMLECMGSSKSRYCNACFSGQYPISIGGKIRKDCFHTEDED